MPNKTLKVINYNGEPYNIEAVSADVASYANEATIAGQLTTPAAIDGVMFDGSQGITHYGVCSQSAGIAQKTVTISNFQTTLTNGAKITVKFANSNTAENPTLNVNSTGAKPILLGGAAIDTESILANRVYELVYDSFAGGSGAWLIVGGTGTSTATPIIYDVATEEADGLMSASDKIKLNTIDVDAQENVIEDIKLNNVSLAVSSKSVNIPVMGGATDSANGTIGLVPAATSANREKFLKADGTWDTPENTTYNEASSSSSGLLSASLYDKLQGIESGAQVNTITGVKGDNESTYRTGNVNITKGNIGLGNVENKSSETIRGELTSSNVTTALGYTPATQDTASGSAAGLMSASDKTKLDSVEVYSVSGISPINVSDSTAAVISHANSGVTAGTYATVATTQLEPSFGDTFEVPGVTVNATGHVTAAAKHNVKIPNSAASSSAAGLMSASDYNKLHNSITIAGIDLELGESATADQLRTALSLSNAMHFIGKTTTAITDGQTTTPTISGMASYTPAAGDVVIDSNDSREYVYTAAGKWEELGPDGSFATADHTHDAASGSNSGFMTATQFTKLQNIEDDADVNVIESISVNNSPLTPSATKNVNITIPTTLNELTDNTTLITDVQVAGVTKVTNRVANIPEASGSVSGVMTAAQFNKLQGIDSGAEVNVIETVKVNGTALTPDANRAVNVVVPAAAVTDVQIGGSTIVNNTIATIPEASSSQNGLLTASLYDKLDGVETGAEVNTITGVKGDAETDYRTGDINITKANLGLGNVENKSSATIRGEITSSNVTTALGYTPATQDTATASTAGLMSASDYDRLKDVEADAEVNIIEVVKVNNTALSVNATDRSVNIVNMGAATASTAGSAGLVPQPGAGANTKYLRGDGTWEIPENTTYSIVTADTDGLMSTALYDRLVNTVQENVIETVKVNGTALTPSNKAVDVSVPIWYATSSTTASTQAKVATTTTGNFKLETGSMVRVKFTNANDYNGTITLNVDSKGAKNIVRVGTTTTTRYYWTAGEVVDFVYDGTQFVMSNKGTATTTYYGLTKLSSATNSTSTDLAATPSAVKAAYDLAAAANTLAGSKDENIIESIKYTVGSETAQTATITSKEALISIPKIISEVKISGVNSNVNLTYNTSDRSVTIPDASDNTSGLMTTSLYNTLISLNNNKIDSLSANSPIAISNSGDDYTISHSNSGVTAASYGPADNATPAWGGTINIPQITVDATGHITSAATYTATIPNNLVTTSSSGLMSASDKIKLDDFLPANSYATLTDVSSKIAANDAMIFKGAVNSVSDLPENPQIGWTYKVVTAGEYVSGYISEVGELLVYDGTTWVRVPTNQDGALFMGSNRLISGSIVLADGPIGQVRSGTLTSSSFNNIVISYTQNTEDLSFTVSPTTLVTGLAVAS